MEGSKIQLQMAVEKSDPQHTTDPSNKAAVKKIADATVLGLGPPGALVPIARMMNRIARAPSMRIASDLTGGNLNMQIQ